MAGRMKARYCRAFAIFAALCIAGLPLRTPADPSPAPAPAQTLAPIGEDGSPAPEPASTASSSPKLLGHVTVSAFCAAFVERFNVAARTMVQNDARLDDAVGAVREYESDFSRIDGTFSSWDHRLQLIAALKSLLETIPKTQAAVNDLRAQAQSATEASRHDALVEGAAQLQASVDHQRIVAQEMQEVLGFMLDTHATEDTIEHGVSATLAPGESVKLDALDAPVPHPGDALVGKTVGAAAGPSAIEQILRVPRDRRLIGEAESGAAVAAARVVQTCVEETTRPNP